ncbi:hypothetical protein GCM10022377_03880 [Zhihengliuella alba]|uniref:Uncharacterized protein n=1 Tax=Zhihengliuella alba TaxID=547018 RepID=A0ABP7CTT9_9MICC
MYVMTIDQRRSRRGPDLVAELLSTLASAPTRRGFERTAGDEIQGVLDDAEAVVRIALDLASGESWSVGIGVGPVETPMPQETRAGRGPAFEYARDAVERAKASGGHIAVAGESPDLARIEAELQLMGAVAARRTRTAVEAGVLVRAGRTQSEVARTLGISQQAVSSRLAHGLWYEVEHLSELTARALEHVEGAPRRNVHEAAAPESDVVGGEGL